MSTKILIVEDEGIIAMHLQRELRALGYDPLEPVATGEDALAVAAETPPGLVLMDIQLAGALDGIETARRLQATCDAPIIYVTAFADEERLAAVRTTAPYAYLVKPVHHRELRLALETTLHRHALDARVRASEAAALESRNTLQVALDAAALGTFRHDVATGLVQLDERAREHFGFDEPDVPFEALLARTHPDDQQRVLDSVTRAVTRPAGEPTNVFECRILPPGGAARWLIVHGQTTFEDAQGARVPRRTIGTTRDVTARRQAEDAQRRVLLASPATIYATAGTASGLELAWVSENVAALTGFSAREALAPGWWRRQVHPDDRAHTRDAPRPRGDERVAIEYRFRRKDGAYVWLRDERKLADAAAGGEELVGAWSDVTERVELEEQLRGAQKMEAVGRLAGGVAHDFNNLLTIIGGNCEFLAGELSAPSARAMLDEIRVASDRAAALTQQLLAFSRAQVLAPRVLDLNAAIARAEGMLRRLIGEDVTVTSRLDPALGTVRVDPVQLEQVLLNLAVNARDAMPDGGRLRIETQDVTLDEAYVARRPDAHLGRHARLRVEDTGVGMTKAVQARAFDPFFTTKPVGQGTGLGLATVFGIVKQSRGHVEIASEPGQGARFDVYLPVVAGAAHDAAPAAPARDPLRGLETILLVEDEPGVRRVARLALERHGYKVLSAENGRGGLEVADAHLGAIDLLVTDVVMPELDGGALARALLAQRPNLKVLYVSGYIDDALLRRGVEESKVELLAKPFSALKLVAKVRAVLDGA